MKNVHFPKCNIVVMIISESGIAAGVRRIEAITGLSVYRYLNDLEMKEENISKLLKTQKDAIESKINSMIAEEKSLKEKIDQFKSLQENSLINEISSEIKEFEGLKLLVKKLKEVDSQSLKNISDKLQNNEENLVVLLASVFSDKILFISSVSKNLIKNNIKAGDIVRSVAQATGGNGGGRPDFAQAGGKDINKLDEALSKVEEFVKEKFN